MIQRRRTKNGSATPPRRTSDGWSAFSYLFGGVIVYGGLGWLLDRWLGTELFLPVGLLGGVALACYTVYAHGFLDDETPARGGPG